MLTKPGNKHHEDHWNRKGHELNIQSGYLVKNAEVTPNELYGLVVSCCGDECLVN